MSDTETTDPFIIRNYSPGDEAYIMSTWLRDWRDYDNSSVPSDIWFKMARDYIERILSDNKVQVLVLVASDNVKEIIGYAVGIPESVLFWCQIRKGQLRGKGLALRLLTQLKCLQNIPAAFQTTLSRSRLRNPLKARYLRHLMVLPSQS